MKNLVKSISDYIKLTKYNIGFVDGDLQSIINGEPIKVNWLKHSYKNRWFADPFILDVTDNEFIVLVEEWYDPINRGRISKLIIDRETFELKDLKIMIDDGTHMSFPAIERKGNDIFIHPENCVKGNLNNYRYNSVTDTFENIGTLCEEPLTDSVITDAFGESFLFSTKLPDANGKELGIYSWDEKLRRYIIRDYYHFADNISRMAGNFFQVNGEIYRPAQVCIKSYGDAVSIQKVTYKEGKWSFEELRRIYSPHPDYDLGFHTLNEYKGFIVVDALGYRKPRMCHILRSLKSFLKFSKIFINFLLYFSANSFFLC